MFSSILQHAGSDMTPSPPWSKSWKPKVLPWCSINVDFENMEDEVQFTDQILVKYDALLFLSNMGEGGQPI